MVLDRIRNLVQDKEPTPNKFTLFVGKKIREAREEMKLSQSSLAKTIYRRQATLSDFENGKSSIDVSTLIMISAALKKPLSYFLPDWFNSEIEKGSLSPQEQELIIQYRRIWSDQNSLIALNQLKALADLDEKQGMDNFSKRTSS